MSDTIARTIQVVAGIFAVAAISIAALAAQPTPETEFLAIVGAAFTLIAALLGVHYGIAVARNGDD